MRRRPARQHREGPWLLKSGQAPVTLAAARILLWAAVISGPAGLAVTLSQAPEAQPRPPAAPGQRDDAAGPAGFAELYVAAYLTAGGDADSVRPFFPDAGITDASAGLVVQRTTVTSIREPRRGYWRVAVAAAVARPSPGGPLPAGLRYFTAPITTAPGPGSRYVATALPSEIAQPSPQDRPQTGYAEFRSFSSGPVADTVRRFLAAYLTGSGELARYMTPGTSLAPVAPAPYRGLQLRSVAPQDGTAEPPAPDDGTRLRVLAEVEARDATGATWPMQYALTLTGRSGRWEVAAIDDVPLLELDRPGS